jgi:hypothetical protein
MMTKKMTSRFVMSPEGNRLLRKMKTVTVRYIQQSGPRSLRNLPADQLRTMLQTLVENGVVKIVPVGKTEGYQLL